MSANSTRLSVGAAYVLLAPASEGDVNVQLIGSSQPLRYVTKSTETAPVADSEDYFVLRARETVTEDHVPAGSYLYGRSDSATENAFVTVASTASTGGGTAVDATARAAAATAQATADAVSPREQVIMFATVGQLYAAGFYSTFNSADGPYSNLLNTLVTFVDGSDPQIGVGHNALVVPAGYKVKSIQQVARPQTNEAPDIETTFTISRATVSAVNGATVLTSQDKIAQDISTYVAGRMTEVDFTITPHAKAVAGEVTKLHFFVRADDPSGIATTRRLYVTMAIILEQDLS